jgi:hypothetical protein
MITENNKFFIGLALPIDKRVNGRLMRTVRRVKPRLFDAVTKSPPLERYRRRHASADRGGIYSHSHDLRDSTRSLDGFRERNM